MPLSDANALLIAASMAQGYSVDQLVSIAGSPTGPKYQAFPSLARLPSGLLYCTYVYATNNGEADAIINASVSSDNGYTWTLRPNPIFSIPGKGVFDAIVSVRADGSGIAAVNVQPGFGGGQVQSIYLSTTQDWITWTAPAPITLQNFYFETCAAPIVEYQGALYLPMYDSTLANVHTAWVTRIYRSTDNGVTWAQWGVPADGNIITRKWSEPAFIVGNGLGTLALGTWLCLIRDDTNHYMYESLSTDGGKTWSTPAYVLPFYGSARSLTQLADGTIVWVGRSGSVGNGSTLASRTGAATWPSTPTAQGLDPYTQIGDYSGLAETSPGKMCIVYGIEWSPTIASVVCRPNWLKNYINGVSL